MPVPGFYNENRNRAFPFVKLTTSVAVPAGGPIAIQQLPTSWIVDAGFVVGWRADFDSAVHKVYLARVYRIGPLIYFEFRSDCPDLAYFPLTFTRSIHNTGYEIEHYDAGDPVDSESDDLRLQLPPAFSGYLVTGDLTSVADYLNDGDTIIGDVTHAVIEPALIYQLSYLNDINVANSDRTRVTAPDGCEEPVWPYDTGEIIVFEKGIQGPIYWKPGFNCSIIQDASDNSLLISASVGAGEGELCEEAPLFSGEQPSIGSSNNLLSGGPLCNETLRSVNGLGGPVLKFFAGAGVSITGDPANNRVTVDVSMIGLSTCFHFSQVSQSV